MPGATYRYVPLLSTARLLGIAPKMVNGEAATVVSAPVPELIVKAATSPVLLSLQYKKRFNGSDAIASHLGVPVENGSPVTADNAPELLSMVYARTSPPPVDAVYATYKY